MVKYTADVINWLKSSGGEMHWKFTIGIDSFVKGPHLHQNISFFCRTALIECLPDIFLGG